jgi:formylglycine-generating enzyme required for sulfatase activity
MAILALPAQAESIRGFVTHLGDSIQGIDEKISEMVPPGASEKQKQDAEKYLEKFLSVEIYSQTRVKGYLDSEVAEIFNDWSAARIESASRRLDAVELIDNLSLIAEHLDRSDIHNMSLLNKNMLSMQADPLVKQVSKTKPNILPLLGKFISLPGGIFTMGSPDGTGRIKAEVGRRDNEGIQPKTIVTPIAVQATKVTRKMWKDTMDSPKFNFLKYVLETNEDNEYLKNCDNCPVLVTWGNTQNFVDEYNEKTGKKVRLPTEAESEYFRRVSKEFISGKETHTITQTPWFFGDNPRDLAKFAWYKMNSGGKLQPVGQKAPNPYGLYDIYGNAAEWTGDRYKETSDWEYDWVFRGDWEGKPKHLRSAYRGYAGVEFETGFRLVADLP